MLLQPRPPVPFTLGRRPAFLPSRLSGLQLWMDASRIAGSDGDQLASVSDYSPNAATISRTASAAVVLKTNIQNGLSVIRYSGAGLLSITGAGFLNFSNALAGMTVIALVNHAIITSTLGLFFISTNASGSSRVNLQRASSSYRTVLRHLDADTPATTDSSSGLISASTWIRDITTIDFAGAKVNRWGNGSLVINNQTFGSANNTSATNAAAAQIGASAGASQFNGDYAELIVYNRVLSTAERALIDTYLSTKWNV